MVSIEVVSIFLRNQINLKSRNNFFLNRYGISGFFTLFGRSFLNKVGRRAAYEDCEDCDDECRGQKDECCGMCDVAYTDQRCDDGSEDISSQTEDG